MKTETNSMRIVKPEKESEKAVVEPQKEKATGKPKYKPVEPVTLETVPEDAVFIRSTDVCKLLNISNSTLRNMRAEHAIPFYKLGGIFSTRCSSMPQYSETSKSWSSVKRI